MSRGVSSTDCSFVLVQPIALKSCLRFGRAARNSLAFTTFTPVESADMNGAG